MPRHLAALLILHGLAGAADYQWSVEVPGVVSEETGRPPRAFLWLPARTERVKGLVFAPQNMLEQPILESPLFRGAMAEIDFGVVWVVPPALGAAGFGRGQQATVEATVQALAVESGYESLLAAPLVPLGHSAMAELPYRMAARMPHRVLAGISLKGAWPEKQDWVEGFGKSGVPVLWVSGEYEWADERAGKAQEFRRRFPQAPFSMLADAGGGHFDHPEALARFLAGYIAAAARNPERPLDATKSGVTIPRWRTGGPDTFWCFDEEQRTATQRHQDAFAGRKPFLLGYRQGGEVVPQVNGTHQQVTLRWLPPDDDLVFPLEGVFLDEVPAGRPERWTGLKAGSAVGHPDSPDRIVIRPICGPVEPAGPNRFALRFDRVGFDNPRRSAAIWFQCEYPGDAEYQRAVQQAVMNIPLRHPGGRPQSIRVEPIPDQVAGKVRSIPLRAASDAGLKVRFYVREGPAEVVGDELRLGAVPRKARLPVAVTVVAWQWGRAADPQVQGAEPVVRTFRLLGSGATPPPDPLRIEARVQADRPGRAIPSDFSGLSREWRRFPAPSADRLDRVHPVYLQLLRNLRGIGIRIGGASADGMKEPPDIERFKQLAEVHDAVRSPMILTVNLARNDPDLCREWIRRAKEHLPAEAIRGFELGNEPDGWFGRHKPKDYAWTTYFDEFAAMRARLVPAEVPAVIGPSWAHGLPPEIADTMVARNPGALSMLTGHAYAFPPAVGREVFRLLREDPVAKMAGFLKPGIEAAAKAGLPFRLNEAGSAWGGGVRGFSDSFASALWILDVQFALAEAGLAGINFHGGGKGHYSAIQDDSDGSKPVPSWVRAMPTYYGLLVFREMTAGGARLLPVTATTGANVRMWAARDEAGRVRVLVLHKQLSPAAEITVHPGRDGRATLKRLEAPAIAVSEGVRWAGQTFDETTDGHPVGEVRVEPLPMRGGAVTFRVAPASAALLTVE